MDTTTPLFITVAICIHYACLLRATWWYVTIGGRGDGKILLAGLLCLMGGALLLLPIANAVVIVYGNPDLRPGVRSFTSIGFGYYVVLTTLAGAIGSVGFYRWKSQRT